MASKGGISGPRSHRRRRRAHTLAELLVVLAIIFILIALSLPYYVKAIKMAKDPTHSQQNK